MLRKKKHNCITWNKELPLKVYATLFIRYSVSFNFLNPMQMSIDAEIDTQCTTILVPFFVFT